MQEHVSGMVNMSLAMKPMGSTESFRDCLEEVLEESCLPLDAPRPGADDPTTIHREAWKTAWSQML